MKNMLSQGLALLIFLGVSMALDAQEKFLPGYIIDASQDTISGEIRFAGDKQNGESCSFRSAPDGEEITYLPGEIFGYRIQYGKYYISRQIEVEGEDRLVFLEFLVSGISNLYYFRSEKKDYYYIELEDERLIRLRNDIINYKRNGVMVYGPSREFVSQLQNSFAASDRIQFEIENAQLGHASLINIVEGYHKDVCYDQECIVYQRDIPGMVYKFSPVGGYGLTFLKHRTLLEQDFYFDYGTSRMPFAGLHLKVQSGRIDQHVSLQVESLLAWNYFRDTHIREETWGTRYFEANLETLNLQNTLAMKYTMPRGKVRPNFAAGMVLDIVLDLESRYTIETEREGVVSVVEEEPFLDPPAIFGFMGQMGLDYHLGKKLVLFTNLQYKLGFGSVVSHNFSKVSTQWVLLVTGIYL